MTTALLFDHSPELVAEDIARLSRAGAVWLRVGRIIDGVSDTGLPDSDLVFDSREILYVGPAANSDARGYVQGRTVPDFHLPTCTLLPCLIESHAHIFLEGAPVDNEVRALYLKQPTSAMLSSAMVRMSQLLRFRRGNSAGCGDKHGVGLALAAMAKETSAGPREVPWIDSPGAAIHHRGRYGSFMGEPVEDFAEPSACVAARVALGADRIKLLVSGIINFKVGQVTAPPQMSADEVSAFVAAATAGGRQTFAHASGTEGVENAVEGGVTTVEHGFFITEDQLGRMRDRAIAWVPTFAPVLAQIDHAVELGWSDEVVGHLRRIVDNHGRMLSRAQEMGVVIVAGSDAGSCGVPHGAGLLRELAHMENAGLSPMDVIKSATAQSARILAFPEPVGRIAAGFRSRMILTHRDPLSTVKNLQNGFTVIFDGRAINAPVDTDMHGL